MTYRELYEKATRQLEKSEITLGEYEEMTKPLDEEIHKKGKWKFIGDNCFMCSECGEVYTVNQFKLINNYRDNRFPKGCPNCGTEMEIEE